MLCTTDPNFPLYMFEKLVDQAELTLNLMRGSPFSPHVSAWHALRGPYVYSNTPIAPPCMKIVCFESADGRLSWATHGVDGYYVGPALDHHRCYKVYITETRATRVTGQLSWHPPAHYNMPGASPLDDCIGCLTALRTSIDALVKTHPACLPASTPAMPATNDINAALDTILSIFSKKPVAPALPSLLNEAPAASQRVSEPTPDAQAQGVPDPTPEPRSQRVLDADTPPLPPPTTDSNDVADPPTLKESRSPRTRADHKALGSDILETHIPHYSRSKISRDKKAQYYFANNVLGQYLSLYDAGAARDRDVVNSTASVLLSNTYETDAKRKKLKIGATRSRWDATNWHAEESKELRRLTEVTGTMDWIDAADKPSDRKASYYNPQVSVKVNELGEIVRRVRGTYGGDGSDYAGDRSSWTADMQTIKILLNVVVSEGADFCTADIGDFYLGSTLERPEYMWLSRAQVPDDIQEQFKDKIRWVGDKTMVRVTKGLYGLPQAGRLAFEKLSRLLKKHDYTVCRNTPCLFKHASNGIMFTLVVVDFAIKYSSKSSIEHLFASIREEYRLEVDLSGSKYIGMSIEYDKKARWLDIWMPGYVAAALKRFNVVPSSKSTHSPMHFTPVTYGKQQQLVEVDDSPPASDAQARFIREVVGVFLYYSRAVDPTMACPLSKLSIGQAKPSVKSYEAILYFLQYAVSYPNASTRFIASDMRLIIYSDASYSLLAVTLSLPHATALSTSSAQSSLPSSRPPQRPNTQASSSTVKLRLLLATHSQTLDTPKSPRRWSPTTPQRTGSQTPKLD